VAGAGSLPCPACGDLGTGSRRLVADHEYGIDFVAHYVACRGCGSLRQEPMPSPGELAAFYPPGYHSQTGQGLAGRLRHHARLRRLDPLVGGGPVLDYGCGNGDFLRFAARKRPGPEYYGFEIGDRREVTVLDGGAVTLVRGGIDDVCSVVPPCRLITMNHVIEHLPDPLAVVSALAAKLAPGGVLEGQTPAAGSLEHRLFRGAWSGYHAPRHTVVFSTRGLATLLGKAGLDDVAVESAFNPAGLAVSLASLPRAGLAKAKPGGGAGPGHIRRGGPSWLVFLALATALAPVDLLSGSPAIVDFTARRAEG
jgi:SAM-dependent methyltransferase